MSRHAPTAGRRAAALALVALLALALLPGTAAAAERYGAAVVIAPDETVSGGLTAVGGRVVVRGTVEGDLRAVGGTVVVAEGGTVTGAVEAVGGSVRVAGRVGDDVDAAGGRVVIDRGATVAGGVDAMAGSVLLGGTVGGDVRVGAGTLRLGSGAVIEGDLFYDAGLVDDGGGRVEGRTVRDPNPTVPAGLPRLPLVPGWAFIGYTLVAHAALGTLLLSSRPRYSRAVVAGAVSEPRYAFAAGLLVFVAGPTLAAFLVLSIIGLPFALVVLAAYGTVLWIGHVYGSLAVGTWVLSYREYENRWTALALGLVLAAIVWSIPVVGGLLGLPIVLLGTGAATRSLRSWYDRLSPRGGL